MRCRNVEAVDPLEENVFAVRVRLQFDPAILETLAVIPRKRRERLTVHRDEETGLDEDLESVADAQHEFTGIAEFLQLVRQIVEQLAGKNASGGNIVAVAESAGEAEDLKFLEERRIFEKSVHVDPFRRRACFFKGVSGFQITVRARCA